MNQAAGAAKLTYVESYSFTMNSAYRKPFTKIQSPAITRHLAFRRDESDFNYEKWTRNIDFFVISLAAIFARKAEDRCAKIERMDAGISDRLKIEAKEGEQYVISGSVQIFHGLYFGDGNKIADARAPSLGKYDCVNITTTMYGSEFLIRVEVFEEYFTVSTSRLIGVELINVGKEFFSNPKNCEMADCFSNSCYNSQWTEFDGIIRSAFDTNPFAMLHGKFSDYEFAGVCPEVFADFRGLVIRAKPLKSGGVEIEWDQSRRKYPERTNWSMIFDENENGPKAIDLLLPLLINGKNRAIGSERMVELDVTWSAFENKSVLYGSSHGAGSSAVERGLSYVLLFAHDDYRATARVVGRLHSMGTARLAALFDFQRIVARDEILTKIDAELAKVEHLISLKGVKRRDALNGTFLRYDERLHDIINSTLQVINNQRDDKRRFPHVEEIDETDSDVFDRAKTVLKAYVRSCAGEDRYFSDLRWCVFDLSAEVKECINGLNAKLASDGMPKRLTTARRAYLRKLRNDLRAVEREADMLQHKGDQNAYIKYMLGVEKKSIASMSDASNHSLKYRAQRSRYHREVFDTLAVAMQITPIVGFQQYDTFVKHRLMRAHAFVERAEVKFNEVSVRLTKLDSKFEAEHNSASVRRIERMQEVGEFILIPVIAPYYVYGVIKQIFCTENAIASIFGLKINVIGAFVLAFFLLLHLLMLISRRFRARRAGVQ